ncbi:MAG: DNA gyrase inhibitor YacG [Azospirillaceae bacterium]|nr:DNA gyrase inhibitor YacG [Azospirillaceae bacterium]
MTPQTANPPRSCPICGRRATAEFLPFCSARCADVDLGRWVSGVYRVAINEPDTGDEDGDDRDAGRLPPQ